LSHRLRNSIGSLNIDF